MSGPLVADIEDLTLVFMYLLNEFGKIDKMRG